MMQLSKKKLLSYKITLKSNKKKLNYEKIKNYFNLKKTEKKKSMLNMDTNVLLLCTLQCFANILNIHNRQNQKNKLYFSI